MGRSLRALADSLQYCRVSSDLAGLPRIVRVLAASRLCVLPMTLYSVLIGGLLAWLDGYSNPWLLLALAAGFLLAHLADNLLNDLTDYKRGVDEPGYFRLLYGPHPLLDGIISVGEAWASVLLILGFDLLLAGYLGVEVSLLIPVLAVSGALVMTLYGGYPVDAKRMGLGELLVAIVWGPIITGGTYLALTGRMELRQAAVYLPYAATVSLVLIGKHLDKFGFDAAKGIRTLPVRLGEVRARLLASLIAILAPLTAWLGTYYYTGSWWSLAALLALPPCLAAARMLGGGKPARSPAGWRVWPLWYAAWGFMTLDATGRYLIAALLLVGLGGMARYTVIILFIAMMLGDLRRTQYSLMLAE